MERWKFFLNKTIKMWPCHNGQVLGYFHILQVKNLNYNEERRNPQENKEHVSWESAWEILITSLWNKSNVPIDFLRSAFWTSFLHFCFKMMFCSSFWLVEDTCLFSSQYSWTPPHMNLKIAILLKLSVYTKFEFSNRTYHQYLWNLWAFTGTNNKKCILQCGPALAYNIGTNITQTV